ncbi:MAG TPA: site-2 protease family protein [Candidatus Methanoperedenaceae archaeon]|nr:site-2 protease family protein [Candidatus Methanoperedenaceae archaeon]
MPDGEVTPATPREQLRENIELTRRSTVHTKSIQRIRTSNVEMAHLFIAWIATSYAFSILLLWDSLHRRPRIEELFGDLAVNLFTLSLLTVGIAFIVHEMAHKFVAQQYGAWAEFRMSFPMLLLAIYLAYQLGFLFAAPGAVMIYGSYLTRAQNGHISIAGTLANLMLAFMFMPLLDAGGFLHEIGRYGVMINLALAAFNMLPIPPLDGQKVWAWSKAAYILTGLMIAVAAAVWFGGLDIRA